MGWSVFIDGRNGKILEEEARESILGVVKSVAQYSIKCNYEYS